MKKNTLYLFILLLITGLNTSCNYLDIVPDETACLLYTSDAADE